MQAPGESDKGKEEGGPVVTPSMKKREAGESYLLMHPGDAAGDRRSRLDHALGRRGPLILTNCPPSAAQFTRRITWRGCARRTESPRIFTIGLRIAPSRPFASEWRPSTNPSAHGPGAKNRRGLGPGSPRNSTNAHGAFVFALAGSSTSLLATGPT